MDFFLGNWNINEFQMPPSSSIRVSPKNSGAISGDEGAAEYADVLRLIIKVIETGDGKTRRTTGAQCSDPPHSGS